MKLSIILAAYNEEKNIKRCLESVKWADEIIIVDGQSTDKTVAIAKKYTAKIFSRENPLMFHKNKQLAIEKATGDWILYLDADEEVSQALKKEVLEAITSQEINGFWLPRKNIIFGKWIRYSGWWPDEQLRLFRNGKAFLPCQSVHEQPELKGEAGHLKTPLIHYNYRTVSQFIDKLNHLYTENDKNIFLAEKKKFHWLDAFRFPTAEFLKRFFKEKGYKDGLHGLVLSLLQAFSALVLFAKVWEEKDFQEQEGSQEFLTKIQKEFRKSVKDTRYWFLTAKINQTKNFLKKLVLRFVRKTGL